MSVTDEYLWILIASGIVCLGMAWGIGAIDVATSVASGIGAKAFTLKQAVFIILIFEFAGAVLMGGAVTETVRTKITDYKSFEGEEDLLMLGMFTSLISATVWLYWAAKFEIPISSAHSIIGGIIGFVYVAKGSDAIVWGLLGYITIFWVLSPCLVACISIAFFVPMRKYLLRREDAWEHTLRVWPIFVVIVTWIGSEFLLLESYGLIHASWMSLVIGIVLATILYLGVIRTGLLENYCEKAVAQDEQNKIEAAHAKAALLEMESQLENTIKVITDNNNMNESGNNNISPRVGENNVVHVNQIEMQDVSQIKANIQLSKKRKLSLKSLEVDIHDDLDDLEARIHATAEKFDPRVEKAFSILQLASASLDNFAHGSNDVANAVAPFASIFYLYKNGKIEDEMTVPFWMIAILIFGMIIGLSTYGYRVVKSLGVKLSCLTNTRGYGTELSSAILVIFASHFGFPASSAHVQVGAIVGTGIAEKVGNDQCPLEWNELVNWSLLAEMFLGWILTVVIAALMSGSLFAMLAYSPYMGTTCHS